MSSVHAAIGIAQIRKLDGFIEKRRANAALLDELLEGVVETPFVDSRCKHVYHQYTIQADSRDSLQESLREKGVGSGVYYPRPLHSLSLFNADVDCPVIQGLCKRVLSLPVRPALSEEEARLVAETVKNSV
jgi:perosamine synthetase